MRMQKTSIPSQQTLGRTVFLIGYSQSGKSSRISCIQKHLESFIAAKGRILPISPIIIIKTGSQSRHIAPNRINIRLRSGETTFISIDYTGQDHQAAYYFLEKMYEMISNIKGFLDTEYSEKEEYGEKEEDLKIIFKNITNISNIIMNTFINPETTMDADLFKKIVFDPFNPFREIASKYKIDVDAAYVDVIINVIQLLRGSDYKELLDTFSMKKLEDVLNYFKNELNGLLGEIDKDFSKPSSLGVLKLNRILCKIDTLTKIVTEDGRAKYDWNRDCDTRKVIEIKEISGIHGFWRGVITGPLLAYLFIGLLTNSWITIILMPSNFEKWYNQLKEMYLRSIDKEKEIATMVDYIKHFAKLDPEISDGIKYLCSCLIHQYINKEKLNVDNETKIVDIICSNLTEVDLTKLNIENEEIKKILNYIYEDKLITLWGEAIAKVYHYKLINVLLNLYLEYLNHVKDQKVDKTFIFDLTYCEGKKFIDGIKAVLSSEYMPTKIEELRYLKEFKNIVNSLTNIQNHNINIYFIPSARVGGSDPATSECTPFEAISIICLSEKTPEVKLKNLNNGEVINVQCSSILKKVKLDWVNKLIQGQS